jgi:DNA-directed RNA polymerase specialized sigma24 family protein
MEKSEQKKNWTITSSALNRLLAWLDGNQNSEGKNYLEMRQRLVTYFDRKNCLTPDDFADETLNRVARRLEEEGTIESETPAKYCYITARFVFLEYLRSIEKNNVPLDDVLRQPENKQLAAEERGEEKEAKEKMLDCLEHCTEKLEPQNREIIIGYYFGTERVKIENRRALAIRLGISVNALSIRACRIRDKLEACVEKCVAET